MGGRNGLPHAPAARSSLARRTPVIVAIFALAVALTTATLTLVIRPALLRPTPSQATGAQVSSSAPLPAPAPCHGCWRPALQTSWQWQLTAPVDQTPNVTMYDIDLFDNSAAVVQALHAQGRRVVCYINAGAWEDWRPDAGAFPRSLLGSDNSGWPGERWLDIRQLPQLLPLIEARVRQCRAKGFDGVEFDNVDGYANSSGFPLTASDQLRFNSALANMAHAHDLSVALKNDLDQIPQLLPYFDWALDEQCFQYQECDALQPFIATGKPVMEVEYALAPAQFCPQANQRDFNALRKNLALDAPRIACR